MVNYLSLWLQFFACDHNLSRLQNRFNQPKGCQKKQAVVDWPLFRFHFFFRIWLYFNCDVLCHWNSECYLVGGLQLLITKENEYIWVTTIPHLSYSSYPIIMNPHIPTDEKQNLFIVKPQHNLKITRRTTTKQRTSKRNKFLEVIASFR